MKHNLVAIMIAAKILILEGEDEPEDLLRRNISVGRSKGPLAEPWDDGVQGKT